MVLLVIFTGSDLSPNKFNHVSCLVPARLGSRCSGIPQRSMAALQKKEPCVGRGCSDLPVLVSNSQIIYVAHTCNLSGKTRKSEIETWKSYDHYLMVYSSCTLKQCETR